MADNRQVGSLWTPEEDVILLQHVARYGTKHWGSLQTNGVLPHRDQKACCNRFILLKRKFFQARAKGQNIHSIFPYINVSSQSALVAPASPSVHASDSVLRINSASRPSCKRIVSSPLSKATRPALGSKSYEKSREVSWLPKLVNSMTTASDSPSAASAGSPWVDQKQHLQQILSSINQSVTSINQTTTIASSPLSGLQQQQQQGTPVDVVVNAILHGLANVSSSPSPASSDVSELPLAAPAPAVATVHGDDKSCPSSSAVPRQFAMDGNSVGECDSDGDDELLAFLQDAVANDNGGQMWLDAAKDTRAAKMQPAAKTAAETRDTLLAIGDEEAMAVDKLLAAMCAPAETSQEGDANPSPASLRPDQLLEEFASAPGRMLFGYSPCDELMAAGSWAQRMVAEGGEQFLDAPLHEVVAGSGAPACRLFD